MAGTRPDARPSESSLRPAGAANQKNSPKASHPTTFHLLDRGIYYLERLQDATNLRYFDFATGRSAVVASNLGSVTSGLTASADGRRIVFTRVDSSVNDLMLVGNFR